MATRRQHSAPFKAKLAAVAELRARSNDVSADVSTHSDPAGRCSIDAATAAGLDCTDAADFRRRVPEESR